MARFRVVPEVVARIGGVSARYTAAEGRSVDHPETLRRLAMIGLATVERCPTCVASMSCDLHGAEATRADGEPIRAARSNETPIGYPETARLYFETFEQARGVRPVFMAREGKALRTLLAAVGVERAQAAIRNAFADTWWRDKATILTIAADPSRHLSAPRSPASAKPLTLQRPAESGEGFKKGKEVEV